jgi:hypothetical protein
MLNDKYISNIIEAIINYKINLAQYKYIEAYKNFEQVFEILEIDSFDISNYYQSGRNYSGNISDEINLSIRRKSSVNSHGSELGLLDEVRSYPINNIA